MKRIIFIICLLFATGISKAQLGIPGQEGVCVDLDATMYVAPATTFYVDGNLYVKDSQFPLWVRSNGTIHLTGNLTCNDPFICQRADSLQPTCQFFFTPKTDTVEVTGLTDSLVLYHTIVNKANSFVRINSGTKVKILDTIDIQAGNFLLNGGNIVMSFPAGTPSYVNHPYIKGENHNNRIFGDSGQVVISTVATSDFIMPSTLNTYDFGNIGLQVKGNNIASDSITIRRGHAKQVYAGNGSISRYFDFSITAGGQALVNDSLIVNYIDSAEYIVPGINKNKLKMFVSPGVDMDYFKVGSSNNLASVQARGTTTDFTVPHISQKNFRITVADEDCSNPPVSSLSNSLLHLCAGDSVVLDAGNNSGVPNTSLLWLWSTGDTTQTIKVAAGAVQTSYSVILRDVRGCVAYDTVVVDTVAPNPVADIYRVAACFGDSVKLKSLSSITSGSIANYYWQFGDATSLTTALNDTVMKLYATSGQHYVTLTVTSNYGCTDTDMDSVLSIPLPGANFTNSFNCISGAMDFVSTSSAGFGVIQYYYWSADTLTNVVGVNGSGSFSNVYPAAGTYPVELVVETFQGCKDSITQSVTIVPANVASFSAGNSCLGDTALFTNNSVCNSGSCSYLWDFGDATQSIAVNPLKLYSTTGVYNVKLKVISAGACTDSVSLAVMVNPKPSVSFTTSPVCYGDVSYFTNTSSIATGSISTYLWDLGNSTTSSTQNTSLSYGAAGTYPVVLTATSDSGCVGSFSVLAEVYAKPVAQYTAPVVCLGTATAFTDNSIGTGLSYSWDFGNTSTSSSSNPLYTYPSSGVYTTSLIVSDVNACADTALTLVTVYATPTPALGGSISTCGSSYVLNAGAGSSYLWQPMNATAQTVTITANGTYTLTVTDANGCTGTDVVSLALNSQVQPNLGADTVACGTILLNAGYPGSTFNWNTGSLAQAVLVNSAGTYAVQVTDINGCVGSDTVVVGINPVPSLSLGPDITPCQSVLPVTLSATTSASVFNWSNGSTAATIAVSTSGSFALSVTDVNGCKNFDTIAVTVLPSPVVNLGPDVNACGSQLLDAQNAGSNFSWSTGALTQTLSVTASGTYSVQVAHPTNGCADSDTITVVINAPVSLFLGNDTSTCSNLVFTLDAGNAGANYSWSTGANTQTINVGSSGAYGVTVSNGLCSAFDVINITVLNAPVVNLGNNFHYLCGNSTVSFNAGSGGTVVWGSDNGFTSTQPQITVGQPGQYWAVVSNGICSASDTVQVMLTNQNLTAYFVASTIDTVGKPVKFVDVSQPAPSSWLWNFGDGFTDTIQSPEHTYILPQTYSVTLTVSNGFCTSQITKSLQVLKIISPQPNANVISLDLVNFNVFPNPVSSSVRTVFEVNDVARINFGIYDFSGKLVFSQVSEQSVLFQSDTDVSELANGIYFIDVLAESEKGFVRKKSKLIVQR